MNRLLATAAAFLACELIVSTEGAEPDTKDFQDFVFLGEARPVFVRLSVQVDGRPVEAAWQQFMQQLFDYLDVNGDGTLGPEEAKRAPSTEQVVSGGVANGFARGRNAGGSGSPTVEALDSDKDGQVSHAELSAWYRKNGLAPFSFQLEASANPLGPGAAFLGGPRPEPPVAAVSEAIFNLLDTDADRKLSKAELAAAPAVLLRLDDDEDEMITATELAPDARPAGNPLGMAMAMAGLGRGGSAGSKLLVPVAAPGQAPPGLIRRIQERYGPKSDRPEDKKLSRQDLALDEAAFAQVDANADGVLDAAELEAFVRRLPDLELMVRLGKSAGPRLEAVQAERRPAPGKFEVKGDMATLDMGLTRLDWQAVGAASRSNFLAGFVRQQALVQFRGADADGNGHVDRNEANANPLLRSQFDVLDRDGDGKLFEKEVTAYLDRFRELQRLALRGCVSLVLSDESRGLFDLLDQDRDARLSIRELRQAPALLALDRSNSGRLTREHIPHSYRLSVRNGPASQGINPAMVFEQIYGPERASPAQVRGSSGPLWFQKMDRNRDGDVSPREFLGSDGQFRQLDADGDGLISAAEAEKAAPPPRQ
jgi:hypothetical protein